MSAGPVALLSLRGVGRSFPSGDTRIDVLRGIDLDIAPGEMLAVVGASGSGKSTLMNILGCLDRPDSGRYTVAGHDVATLDGDALARLRREHFGFVFQRYHLMPRLSAAANVEVPAIYAGVDAATRRARALALLARLGLADRAGHRPGQLSGGQQQRVSIARALMNGGQVILADEPTGALDRKSGHEVIAILRELNAQGHTVILVTHDMQLARCTRRIVEIDDGAIVADRVHVPDGAAALPAAAAAAMPAAQPARGALRRLVPDAALAVEAVRMAWRSMLAHRMRTALTMLGIVIGIAAVVSVVGIGEGGQRYSRERMSAYGVHRLWISAGADYADDRAASVHSLVEGDLDALAALPYVDSVSPELRTGLRLRFRGVDVSGAVSGVGEHYFRVANRRLSSGTFFDAEQVRRLAQVAVIDAGTARKLFGGAVDPIGQTILVGNVPCTVIGVAVAQRDVRGDDKSLAVWLPYATVGGRLLGHMDFDTIGVRARDDVPSGAVEDGIGRVLQQRHGTKDFHIFNMDGEMKAMAASQQVIALVLSLVAMISLLVGGIGVMNIMLVSVTERTREIGIRMAVGARQREVLLQFLAEAVLVCLASGVAGVLLSLGIGFVFSLFVSKFQMIVSLSAATAAFFFSSSIGVVFGYLPARSAARLDPVEALARE